MGRGTQGLPTPAPHDFTGRYMYRLCELFGEFLDKLEEPTRPVDVDSASGAELVTEPAPDAAGAELVTEPAPAEPVDQPAADVEAVDQAAELTPANTDVDAAVTGAPTGEPVEPKPATKPQQGTRRARRTGRK